MSCCYPIDAWRAAKCNESGKRGIVFRIQDGFSDQPLQVPCGKCIGCSVDRARIWAVRMHHEASLHEQNCFVTLTYRDPAPAVLSRRDLQLFFKRLRLRYGKLRYFACGEYGTRTHRPHYHAIIFGKDFLGGAYDISDSLYGNPVVDAVWGHGFTSIGRCEISSCMYVAGYVSKKVADRDTFNVMSRRPGIGHRWVEKYRDDIKRTGKVVIEGKEFPIPKAYLSWYEDDFEALKAERKRYFQDLTGEQIWNKRVQLQAKELMYKARANLKQEVI